ncbi:MAG: hypothetical protein ACLVJH_16370 [Faecalibacterium prausnitzii]
MRRWPGGTPILIPAIGVLIGIAMEPCGHKYSLAIPRADLRQRGDHADGTPAGRPCAGAQLR